LERSQGRSKTVLWKKKSIQQRPILHKGDDESKSKLSELMQKAKDNSLWALGHPKDIGGEGMPFMEYVYINEVVGRSSSAMVALGTHSLQDSIMLREFAPKKWRDEYSRTT
jgi:alkylation response protein AidB-like acyl-CoA dehydrogenase